MPTANISQHQSATHNTGPGAITAGDSAAPAGRPPTRAERLERWRDQPTSVRPPEPVAPRPGGPPSGGYMMGSGTFGGFMLGSGN